MGAEPRPVPWGRLALLLLLCALLRGWLILAPPDDFFENGQVPHEELLRGVAAQELLDGPLAPIQRYQVNNFWGGSLVVSALATVPYALIGPKVVALRLVALGFGLLCVLFLFLLLHRHASARAAWIGALLLAFAPPGYAMSSCTTYGTHLEANALALLVAWLFLEERASGGRRSWLPFVLGLAAGFALWFGFSLAVVLAAWLLHELAQDRGFLLRARTRWIALGFLAGFWPWIRYQLVHGWTGLEVYDEGFGYHLVYGVVRGRAPEKLLDLVARSGPQSFCFRDTLGVDGLWAGRVLFVVLALAVARAAWLARRDLRALLGRTARATPATFALAFLALFGAAYVLTAFDPAERDWIFDLRYLMPPVPFVALCAGLAGAELVARGGAARTWTLAALALVLGACLVGTLRQARPERVERNLATPGASRALLQRFLVRNFGPDPDAAEAVARRIVERRSGEARDELLRGFGRGLAVLSIAPPPESHPKPRDLARARGCAESLERVPAVLPPDLRGVFLAGAGR